MCRFSLSSRSLHENLASNKLIRVVFSIPLGGGEGLLLSLVSISLYLSYLSCLSYEKNS